MTISVFPESLLNRGTGQPPQITTVNDTDTVIAPANSNRTSIMLTNVGKQDVWASCDASPILGQGLFLGRSGGSLVIDQTAFTEGNIRGICDSGLESDITFQELIR